MDKPLVELVNEYLEADTLKLPLFHPVAVKLQELLMTPDFRMEQVEEIILQDQSLASHILRMSNSAFFRGLTKITTIHEAVIRLGAKQVASIVMTATQEDNYRFAIAELDRFAAELWKHAMASAIGSRWLAKKTGYHDMMEEAFLAGLLHDIGKLFILKVVESIHQPGRKDLEYSKDLILEAMAQIHSEAGYRLMKRWNLPDLYADITRDHHNAEIDTANILFCFMVVADCTAKKLGLGLEPDPTIAPCTMIEAQVLGLGEVALAELEIVIEDAMGLEGEAEEGVQLSV